MKIQFIKGSYYIATNAEMQKLLIEVKPIVELSPRPNSANPQRGEFRTRLGKWNVAIRKRRVNDGAYNVDVWDDWHEARGWRPNCFMFKYIEE